MIVILNGALGVGKTSVGEALTVLFEKAMHIDSDAVMDVHPFKIYDDARITHLYRTLALLVGFHREHGYTNFVINYVFESAESMQELLDLLRPHDPDLHTYWLTCDPAEMAERVRKRGRGELSWELDRCVELGRIQAQAARLGFIGKQVDTTHRSPAEAARAVWDDLFGSPPPPRLPAALNAPIPDTGRLLSVTPWAQGDGDCIRAILERVGWAENYIRAFEQAAETFAGGRNSAVYLAHVEVQAAAFIFVEVHGWNRLAQIQGLAVDPAFQRKGAATRLVGHAEAFARGHAARGIYVDTPTTNTGGRRFYEALGYRAGYVMPRYYEDHVDGVTYQKFFDNGD